MTTAIFVTKKQNQLVLSNKGSVTSLQGTKTILRNPKGKQRGDSKMTKRDRKKKKKKNVRLNLFLQSGKCNYFLAVEKQINAQFSGNN